MKPYKGKKRRPAPARFTFEETEPLFLFSITYEHFCPFSFSSRDPAKLPWLRSAMNDSRSTRDASRMSVRVFSCYRAVRRSPGAEATHGSPREEPRKAPTDVHPSICC